MCRRLGPSQGSRCRSADAFGFVVVKNFEGVAVEDGDDPAGKVGGNGDDRFFEGHGARLGRGSLTECALPTFRKPLPTERD